MRVGLILRTLTVHEQILIIAVHSGFSNTSNMRRFSRSQRLGLADEPEAVEEPTFERAAPNGGGVPMLGEHVVTRHHAEAHQVNT
jgi:hypothetical protein